MKRFNSIWSINLFNYDSIPIGILLESFNFISKFIQHLRGKLKQGANFIAFIYENH